MSEPIKKKRGRKPKNAYIYTPTQQVIDEIKTDEENIILHLPITLNDINPCPSVNTYFIKQEPKEEITYKQNYSEQKISYESNYTENARNANKIIIHNIKINSNTKCWWCHNIFSTPPIQLPDNYYNNTFYCSGHYCSYNCAKSYNLNMNDNLTWKRCSLLNLLYYQTYAEYKEIIPAPSWLILEEYGGTMSIDDFRNNFTFNSKEYILLHPPLISRQMQIEESYKINTIQPVPINNLNKLYMDTEVDLQLRRNKPIVNSQMNLENTMGLTKVSRRK